MNTKRITVDELIDREARNLAKTIIEERLARDNLPLPRESALDIHIGHLLSIDPSIRIQAALRVKARTDAYSESLKAIGLEIDTSDQAVDIDL